MRYIFVFLFLSAQIGFAQSSSQSQEALMAFESENYEEAEPLFLDAYKEHKDAESLYYLGRISLEKNEPAQAIKRLEEAVEKNEQIAEYHYWLSEAYFRRIDEVGMMKKASLAKKGRKAAERTVRLDPTHRDARTSLVYFYTQAPSIAGGSKEKALEQAEILRSYHPKRGRMMLAMVYSSQDEFEKADGEYTALLNEFADDADMHYAAGMHFQRRENYAEAIRIFEKAVTINPDQLNALYQIGRTVVFADEMHEVGEKALQQYLEKELTDNVPTYASAWWRLGMIYELEDRSDEARAAYESALELEPEHEEAQKSLKELKS